MNQSYSRAAGLLIAACLVALMNYTSSSANQRATPNRFSYEDYDRVVSSYVDRRGLVDYAGLKKDLGLLKGFTDRLAASSPENKPELFATEDERKRYYLTAYNAYVLFYAASAYPDKHALWARLGWFKNKDIVLGGRKLTLNDLEHNIIRKKFLDPRIHFYLNCGAKSCPPLKAKSIAENATEAELEEAACSFINDPSNVRFDAATRTLYLSKIFDWYEDDFINYLKARRGLDRAHVSQYVALYLAGERAQALARVPASEVKIKHLGYDKSLNDR
ncbi:MAG TPA: DUF547 domain-containing protein [Blastocatellia bacterium]|nr:DUF547 domain-containing protein [Blastocatellia bacterium]